MENTSLFSRYRSDVLSGLTVSLALVPEAVAFAFVAGLHPLIGMYAAVIVGFITASLGGRPGMISAAAGSLAVVMVGLVVEHGVEYLFAAVILMGLLQILIGALKLGRFIRMVPMPVMLGFVNGLAIVIFMAQIGQFKDAQGAWLQGMSLWAMFGIIAVTMVLIYLLPRISKAIPAALVAIIGISLAVVFFDIDAVTVGDRASVEGTLSVLFFGDPGNDQLNGLHLPMIPLSLESLWIVLPYAIILTIIGTTESLLTMTLIDDITETRGQGNRECIALGAANTVSGFFGTMGGCALIGQSMINIRSGGLGRLSGIVAASCLLAIILVASPLIEQIPIGALVGLMFVVVIATFNWSSVNIMRGMKKSDTFVMILVTLLTVVFDLAVAVVAGVVVAALVFAWQHAQRIHIEYKDEPDKRVYTIHGPLFFASVHNFVESFDPKTDPDMVCVDFRFSRVYDHSGIEAIDNLTRKYQAQGKMMGLRHLSPECRKLLKNASNLVEINVSEDPHYHVSLNK